MRKRIAKAFITTKANIGPYFLWNEDGDSVPSALQRYDNYFFVVTILRFGRVLVAQLEAHVINNPSVAH